MKLFAFKSFNDGFRFRIGKDTHMAVRYFNGKGLRVTVNINHGWLINLLGFNTRVYHIGW